MGILGLDLFYFPNELTLFLPQFEISQETSLSEGKTYHKIEEAEEYYGEEYETSLFDLGRYLFPEKIM